MKSDSAIPSGNELYDALPPEIIQKLRTHETATTFPAGTRIIQSGVHPGALIIIMSGQVEISLPVGKAAFFLVLAGKGKVLGLRSVISGDLPDTNATTLEATTVVMVPERKFVRILHQHPQLYGAIAKVLSADLKVADSLLREAADRAASMRSSSKAM